MTQTIAQAPKPTVIQPDFATLPRKVEPGARTNLLGLTRERLRDPVRSRKSGSSDIRGTTAGSPV